MCQYPAKLIFHVCSILYFHSLCSRPFQKKANIFSFLLFLCLVLPALDNRMEKRNKRENKGRFGSENLVKPKKKVKAVL